MLNLNRKLVLGLVINGLIMQLGECMEIKDQRISKSTKQVPQLNINDDPLSIVNSETFLYDLGKIAFWAHNPENLEQRILLVPSIHMLNPRFVDPEIIEKIKASEILILEQAEAESLYYTWDDKTIIYDLIAEFLGNDSTLEKQKTIGILKDTPLMLSNRPWADHLNQETKDYLTNNFTLSLEEKQLSNYHPLFILSLLEHSLRRKMINQGLDAQMMRYFDLKKKPKEKNILGLETIEKSGLEANKEALEPYVELDVIVPMLDEIELYINNIEILNIQPPLSFEMLLQIDSGCVTRCTPDSFNNKERNDIWIPRILDYQKENPNKSICILVGGGHFPGTDGIVQLLSNRSFTFTNFKNQFSIPSGHDAQLSPVTIVDKLLKESQFSSIEEPNHSPKPASVIRVELINITKKILSAQPQDVPQNIVIQEIQSQINNYIKARNALYADPDIIAKEKIIQELIISPFEPYIKIKDKILQLPLAANANQVSKVIKEKTSLLPLTTNADTVVDLLPHITSANLDRAVDVVLNDDNIVSMLPKVKEPGVPDKDPKSIRGELILQVKIFLAFVSKQFNEGNVPHEILIQNITHKELIQNIIKELPQGLTHIITEYIDMRNNLYSDVGIVDKSKIVPIIMKNPSLDTLELQKILRKK